MRVSRAQRLVWTYPGMLAEQGFAIIAGHDETFTLGMGKNRLAAEWQRGLGTLTGLRKRRRAV
jgi:hypothetical protein